MSDKLFISIGTKQHKINCNVYSRILPKISNPTGLPSSKSATKRKWSHWRWELETHSIDSSSLWPWTTALSTVYRGKDEAYVIIGKMQLRVILNRQQPAWLFFFFTKSFVDKLIPWENWVIMTSACKTDKDLCWVKSVRDCSEERETVRKRLYWWDMDRSKESLRYNTLMVTTETTLKKKTLYTAGLGSSPAKKMYSAWAWLCCWI